MMIYALALLYLVCVYIRPGEIVPGWEGVPFAAFLAGASVLGMAGSLIVRPRSFWNLPHDWFVLGFFAAVLLSNLTWGWLAGTGWAFIAVSPVVFCYFVIRSAATTATRLRWIGYALVVMTLFHAVNGIAQYHTGVGLGDIEALDQAPDVSDEVGEEEASAVRRIRGTGIFNDPNDLALAFVVIAPFLAGPLMRKGTRIHIRIGAALCLVPIVLALYYTNSRGGVLGLGTALLPYALQRFGKLAGPVVATAGLAMLLAFGPSRMTALDASETSAQDRVQSWAEGLQMFRSRPLFGVGYGRYTDFNDLVAHNSFVHTLAETGLLGAFCFIGMGYWFFQPSLRPEDVKAETDDTSQLRAWGDDLRCGGLGLAVCAMFLSRQYTAVPFIWLAMSGSYTHLLEAATPAAPVRTVVHLTRIAVITISAIVGTYIVVRLLSGASD